MKKSCFLSIVIVIIFVINMYACFDINCSAATESPVAKVDFSSSAISSLTGLSRSTSVRYGSSPASSMLKVKAAIKETKTFDFSANSISTDWSRGDTIVIPIYNVYANGDVVNFVMTTSGADKVLSNGYFLYKIKLDWTGWKLLKIPKSDFIKHSSSKWTNINSLFFNIGGWSEPKPSDTLEMYVDSVYLTSNIHTGEMNIDCEDPLIARAMGLEHKKSTASDSACGARFKASSTQKDSKKFSFSDYCVSTDWSGAESVQIKIYNAKANNQRVNFVMVKNINNPSSDGYYLYSFYLSKIGWQTIDIPLTSFKAYGSIKSFSDINSAYFNVGGWPGGSDVASDVDFCISSISGSRAVDYIKNSIPDSSALYAGADKALNKLSYITLENPVEYKDGILYVPVGLFGELYGYTVSGSTVSNGVLMAEFTENSYVAGVGDYTHHLVHKPYMFNSVVYVGLSDLCDIFSVPCMTDGRLAIIGSESDIDFVKSYDEYGVNEVCESISAILMNNSSDGYTDSDCDAVISNWLELIVGNEELNNMSDSLIASRINRIDNEADSVRSLLIKSNGSDELFSDQTSTETAHMTLTAQRIKNLALAYGTSGSKYYNDSSLLEDILYSLEWFYENRYGVNELNGVGWHSTSGFNWADWKAGTPRNLIDALMIVKNHLTSEQISNYLMLFNELSPTVYSSGANYIDAAILIIGAAALENKPQRIAEIKQMAEEVFLFVDNGRQLESQLDSERQEYTPNKGQGFYRDGSYIFHTLHAMNGAYGLSHLEMASELVAIFHDTAYEISKSHTDNVADWIINSFDSVIYGTRMMRMVKGRQEDPSGIGEVKTIVSSALRCFDSFGAEDQKVVGAIIKKYHDSGRKDINGSVDTAYIQKYNEVVSNADSAYYNTNLSKVFGNIDKVMHRRENWGIGVSMSSSRIFNYECINNQNVDGWYLGDGRYEVILADEANTSVSSYWKNINYYRLPGTTVDTQNRKAVSVCQGNEYLSSKDFVGGVELEGKYSTAAMHLESYHNESDYGKDGGSYGGPNPAHESDLTAKKSYFMFDNEVYCLGAEICATANNNAEVMTVFENKPALGRGSAVLEVQKAGSNVESKRFDFAEFGINKNWSSASKISVPIYNEVANGDYVNIIASKKVSTSDGYWRYNLCLDWSGWKTVEIPLSSFSKYGSISNWSEISSIYFNIGGWRNPAPLASTVINISDVKVLDSKSNVISTIEFSNSTVCEKAQVKFAFRTPEFGDKAIVKVNTSSGELSVEENSNRLAGDIDYLNINNKTGYVFFDGDLKTNASSNGYFEGYISHGVNPQNESYAYAILPGMDFSETEKYAQNPDVEILSNTGDVQAVRYKKENITSIVFWNPGSFYGITVSEPMMVMVKEAMGKITLSVSDPTHKLTIATVSFDKALLVSEKSDRVSQNLFGEVSSFDFDFSQKCGSSIEVDLISAMPVVRNIEFKNESGKIVSKYLSQNEESLVISVDVANLSSDDESVRVYVAMYNADGALESVELKGIEDISYAKDGNLEFEVAPSVNTGRIEVFVWDKLTNKPVRIQN